MSSAKFLATTDEVRERTENTGLTALDAQRVIMREKLFAEVQDIRTRSRQGFRVEHQIADVLDALIARLT